MKKEGREEDEDGKKKGRMRNGKERGGDEADGQRNLRGDGKRDRGKEVETREQYAASMLRGKCRCHNTQMEKRINRYFCQDMWSYALEN